MYSLGHVSTCSIKLAHASSSYLLGQVALNTSLLLDVFVLNVSVPNDFVLNVFVLDVYNSGRRPGRCLLLIEDVKGC